MTRSFDSADVQKALSYAKTPSAWVHWQSLLTDFNAMGKFNLFKAPNLLFLATSGMLVRFVGIGGTRCLVDWFLPAKDKKTGQVDETTRRRQTAERMFIEVGGTFLATYVGLQLMIDSSGKALSVASRLLEKPLKKMYEGIVVPEVQAGKSQWGRHWALVQKALLKPRSLSPEFLLEKAQTLQKAGKISEADVQQMTAVIMEMSKRRNPYSFGFNAPEQNIYGHWNALSFAEAMKKKGLGHLYETVENEAGQLHFKGFLNENQQVDNYFARVQAMGLLTTIGASAFSAVLSGAPVQKANDTVFRSWYKHRLEEREAKQKKLHPSADSKEAPLYHSPYSRGGGDTSLSALPPVGNAHRLHPLPSAYPLTSSAGKGV